jgi:hypothetical protein
MLVFVKEIRVLRINKTSNAKIWFTQKKPVFAGFTRNVPGKYRASDIQGGMRFLKATNQAFHISTRKTPDKV